MNSRTTTGTLRLRLIRLSLVLLGIALVGTAGYMVLEGYSPLDALYMTVITLTTVGYGEVHELSTGGRLFTIALILGGVGTMAFLLSTLVEYLVGGELTGSLRIRRMQHMIDSLTGHYIVCGFGRVGQEVVRDLRRQGAAVVVIESDPDPAILLDPEVPHVSADASSEEALERAGIERARGLVAATGDDSTNIVISLTARTLQPGLMIVARASHSAAEAKLLRAGATSVVSPHRIGGQRMAAQLLQAGQATG